MGVFNSKIFNAEVFLKYLETIPQDTLVKLLTSGALVEDRELAATLPEQAGGNYITKPLTGRIGGNADIYDGATNINATSLETYSQGMVVIGRAKGFTERDFSQEITGHDFMSDVAAQLQGFWDGTNEALLLSILKGIFGSALAANVVDSKSAPQATTLNSAIQKVGGDLKDHFNIAFMHSAVATELENQNLLTYVMYNDANGIQRPTNIAYWNGKLVLVSDLCPSTHVAGIFVKTSDTAVVAGKKYFTKAGSVYNLVLAPVTSDIANYYECTRAPYDEHTVYVLGKGAIRYANCGVKVPVEMDRDPAKFGGEDALYSRERLIFAPYGVTFKQNAMASLTPTNTELETAASWELVKSSAGVAINTKVVPLAAIKTRVYEVLE